MLLSFGRDWSGAEPARRHGQPFPLNGVTRLVSLAATTVRPSRRLVPSRSACSEQVPAVVPDDLARLPVRRNHFEAHCGCLTRACFLNF